MLIKPFRDSLDQLTSQKQNAIAAYPQLWSDLIRDWQSDHNENLVWLTYSANYLFQTAGLRWALDPLSLFSRVGGDVRLNYQVDLAPLKLILLTHAHADHFDSQLLAKLLLAPLTWIIPEFLMDSIRKLGGLGGSQVIIPQPGVSIYFDRLKITPFNGLHFSGRAGAPEIGYLVEFPGGCWLFPGDTRNYDITALPGFGQLDGVFAHLWLGKGEALNPEPPLIKEFCRFVTAFDVDRIILTHFYEYGREPEDLWTMRHFKIVENAIHEIAPTCEVRPGLMGDRMRL